jgi:hypothetical protein
MIDQTRLCICDNRQRRCTCGTNAAHFALVSMGFTLVFCCNSMTTIPHDIRTQGSWQSEAGRECISEGISFRTAEDMKENGQEALNMGWRGIHTNLHFVSLEP